MDPPGSPAGRGALGGAPKHLPPVPVPRKGQEASGGVASGSTWFGFPRPHAPGFPGTPGSPRDAVLR